MNDCLTKSLGRQDKMWCTFHRDYLVKQITHCFAVCCVKYCTRIARPLCLGKGEFCCNAVCQAHAEYLLKGDDRVDNENDENSDIIAALRIRGSSWHAIDRPYILARTWSQYMNKGYGVPRRRMHHYPNLSVSSMMQHIVSITKDACASLLYPEGQSFPRIFWNS